MGKRKAKVESSDEEVVDLDDDASDSDFVVEEKPKRPRSQSASPRKTPAKKRPPPRPKVTEVETQPDGFVLYPPSLIYRIPADSKPNEKIAAFDMDGTLIVTESGAQFPLRPDDWKFFSEKVPEVVRQYAQQGYKIVIFSNQGGIKSALNGKMSENVRIRLGSVISQLNVPVSAFMATQKDNLRKPETGMWDFFVREGNGAQQPDLKESFFVGDAAGRDGDPVGSSDRDFAEAIGLPFKTPEEAFGPASKGGGHTAGGPNADLANIFLELADFNKDHVFKARAFKTTAKAMEDCPEKITSADQAKKLKLKGVGKGSLAVIGEFLTTGKVAVLDPANQAAEQAAKAKAAEEKAAGDAFAFM